MEDASNDKDPSDQQQSQSSENNSTDQVEPAGKDTEVDEPMASDNDVDSYQEDVAADMDL